MAYDSDLTLIAKLHEDGLLPDEYRERAAAKIAELTLWTPDGTVFCDANVRSLLNEEEFEELHRQFKDEVIDRLESVAWDVETSVSSRDAAGMLGSLKEHIDHYITFETGRGGEVAPSLRADLVKIEERLAELEIEDPERQHAPVPPMPTIPDEISEIFVDVDD
jgi:hypothetical protein